MKEKANLKTVIKSKKNIKKKKKKERKGKK